MYGHGHYVFFSRNEAGLWGKLDDEEYSVLGRGKWVDAVFEMVRLRYNPTGLIYHRSHKTEALSVNLCDWLKLEQWAVKVEQDRISWAKAE